MSYQEHPSSAAAPVKSPIETLIDTEIKSYTAPLDLESLKRYLAEDALPQPAYQITRYWQGNNPESTWYEVTLKHNDIAADPFSQCKSSIIVHFSKSQKGEKETYCRFCQEKVSVGISNVQIGLGLLPRWC